MSRQNEIFTMFELFFFISMAGFIGWISGAGYEQHKARVWAVEKGYATWLVDKDGRTDWCPK